MRGDLLTVVGNLIDNAVEACQYGGRIEVSIVLRLDDAGDELTVTVADNGPGIPAALRAGVHPRVLLQGRASRPALPRPRDRTDPGQAHRPTVRRERRHHRPVPLRRVRHGAVAAGRSAGGCGVGRFGTRERRVSTSPRLRTLIVDDDRSVARIHRLFVDAHEGFTVVGEAHSGAAALEQVEPLAPDVVLLDVYLPDFSGLEVLGRLSVERARESR